MASVFLSLVAKAFTPIETLDGDVEAIWLHPEDIARHLVPEGVFDRLTSEHRALIQASMGPLEGHLFGARVYGSTRVPKGHIVVRTLDDGEPNFSEAKPLDDFSKPERRVPRVSRFRRKDPLLGVK